MRKRAGKGDKAFQSTLPVWGATSRVSLWPGYTLFQSTLPVWGATAPAGGSGVRLLDFNPRSPCGERRAPKASWARSGLFQSTLPVWGATYSASVNDREAYISIHAPRVGSDPVHLEHLVLLEISIHAPRVGSDRLTARWPGPPRRISIHAPRVGSDPDAAYSACCRCYFNPRSPCGERRTARPGSPPGPRNFNPRSPCGERPARPTGRRSPPSNFNPRSPCGERLLVPSAALGVIAISIHAPRVGSDPVHVFRGGLIGISIHAPRVGSDSISLTNCTARGDFNPRSPCGERRCWR